jgi:Uma2 family endonuclease
VRAMVGAGTGRRRAAADAEAMTNCARRHCRVRIGMATLASPPPVARQPVRFTVAKFYRMAQAGILNPNHRYELIEGEIIRMLPPGPEHCQSVDSLLEFLIRLLGGKYQVRCQGSVQLSNISEPLPDFAILKKRAEDYRKKQPGPDDTLLLIEVSGSSLSYDKNRKAAVYAAAGVVEYWIVNLRKRCLHVMRKPSREGYRDVLTLEPDDEVRALKVPELKVKVGDLLLK